MLKIKDNVDLKELALEYDLEYEPILNKYYYVYIPFLSYFGGSIHNGNILTINNSTREIELLIHPPYWEKDILYKTKNKILKRLKKNELVEKVEDEKNDN